jgi:hypothetical protein
MRQLDKQGCHKGRFWRKITVRTFFSSERPRTSARVRVYPADVVLPTDVFLPSADAVRRPRKRERKKNLNFLKKNLVVVAGLERENFFSIFNIQYSIFNIQYSIFGFRFSVFGFQSPKSPNSPNSPSSAGFVGEAARRRRFFQPSSPSYPSKLYSSLGWLNSKVPKPFPPFSLRLIDVDGF